jgi:phosphomannomutase
MAIMTAPAAKYGPDSLRARLGYEPRELEFGTSGRRGEVVHLTQLEIYINTLAELEYLQSLPPADGGISRGSDFYFAYDLRPSSTRYVAEVQGRGEIAQAVEQAVRDAGMIPVNLGLIPTPALVHYGIRRGRGSIMVTGSHIPFEWNGYKTHTARGELRKEDEGPISESVHRVRDRMYGQPFGASPFDEQGRFKGGRRELPPADAAAGTDYIERYLHFFAGSSLGGKRIVVYEHSAAGRDLLIELLQRFDAQVIPAGRSESFVPLDTENIDDSQLAAIQLLADEAAESRGSIDAVVSTDGDGDRPLVLGVDPTTAKVRFFPGDLVGMIVAEYLGSDAVIVPISCNDAIDRGRLARIVEPKTRIGSPYVIAGMEKARSRGKRTICGWEANGGFLTGSDIERNGRILQALPTRDAVLPILSVLFSAHERRITLAELFAQLPSRFSRAALLRRFPRTVGKRIVARLSPAGSKVREAVFADGEIVRLDNEAAAPAASQGLMDELKSVRDRLGMFFTPELGFSPIARLTFIDGVRIGFRNGDVAHLRPSGNADDMRVYAVADTQGRADAIAEMGVAEPSGILRRMAQALGRQPAEETGEAVPIVLSLKGAVQHYDWGGYDFIPALLGLRNEERRPFAELWIGAHPLAPSIVRFGNRTVSLDRLIEERPDAILGAAVASRFAGGLPYLLKVLDARRVLSIQAHPTKKQAEEGYLREEAAGIVRNAANRNYKDDNHKPEVLVALTDLRMLHGFRPLEEIAGMLAAVPEFAPFAPGFAESVAQSGRDPAARRELLRRLYVHLMTMEEERVDTLMRALTVRLERKRPSDRNHPDFWALHAAQSLAPLQGHFDRGIFSIYLLNLVHLRPGQGVFQSAGVLHAFLEGAGVELMANSDNVLRGGLTLKHVDVEELLRIVSFESGPPAILAGETLASAETVYRTDAEEFELSRIEIGAGGRYAGSAVDGPVSLIMLEGAANLVSAGRGAALGRGNAILVPHGVEYEIEAAGGAMLYKASIPVPPAGGIQDIIGGGQE